MSRNGDVSKRDEEEREGGKVQERRMDMMLLLSHAKAANPRPAGLRQRIEALPHESTAAQRQTHSCAVLRYDCPS